MKFKVPEHDQLEEGLYPATLTSIEPMNSERGIYWRWTFAVQLGEGEELSRIANSSASLGRKTKGYRWLTAALGRELEPGEEGDFDEILPARCRIIIKRSEDGEYDRVDDVLRADSHSQAPRSTSAVAPVSESREMDSLMQHVDAATESDDIPF
jgi:hypothetical protein